MCHKFSLTRNTVFGDGLDAVKRFLNYLQPTEMVFRSTTSDFAALKQQHRPSREKLKSGLSLGFFLPEAYQLTLMNSFSCFRLGKSSICLIRAIIIFYAYDSLVVAVDYSTPPHFWYTFIGRTILSLNTTTTVESHSTVVRSKTSSMLS